MKNRLICFFALAMLWAGNLYATQCSDIFPGPQTFTTNAVESIESGVTCNGGTCSPGSFTAVSPFPSYSSSGNFSSSTIVGGTTYAHNSWNTSENQTVSYSGTGTVIIYIKNNATIKKGVKINVGGNPANVLMIFNRTLKIEENAVINAFIYVNGSETTIEKNSTISGGIAAKTKLTLKESSTYTYTPADADNIDASSFCEGSAPSVHHYEIEHDAVGSTCTNESVTVKACTDASCSSLSTISVSLDFQIDALTETSATFTGSTSVSISHLISEIVTFSVANPSITPTSSLVCDRGSGTSCDMAFASASCPAVAHYTMDETSWGTVVDSQNGFNGTAFNGANTTGGTCRYGQFDGVDDYVQVPHNAALNGSEALTYMAFVRADTWSGLDQIMAKSVHGGGAGRAQMGIFSESGVLKGRAETLNGRKEINTALPVTAGDWVHIAMVFNGTSLVLYLDGIAVANTNFSATTLVQTTDPLNISKRVGTNDYYFHGLIDDVRVYSVAFNAQEVSDLVLAASHCPLTGIDHYQITHDGSGLTCDSEPVTIRACLNSDCSSLNTESVTLDFQGNGTTISSQSFTGSTIFNFNHTTAETLTLAVANPTTVPTNTLVCDSGSGSSCDIDFATAGFQFLYGAANSKTVDNQVAGSNFADTLKLQAVKDSNGVCTGLFTGNVNVDLTQQNVSPGGVGGLSFTVDSSAIAKHPTFTSNVSLYFGSDSIATIPSPIYQDAGQIQLYARYNAGGVSLSGNSNSFWVSPAKLVATAQDSGGVDINGDSAGSETIHKAGEDFALEVMAINAASPAQATQNYQPGQIQFLLDRTGPASGGADGSLTYASGNSLTSALSPSYQNVSLEGFSSGVSTFNAANYSEVGLLKLGLQDSNYGGEPITVPGDAINIGRFTPDHFDIEVVAGAFDDACGTFSYIGQYFGYSTAPNMKITAKNLAGDTTENYTEGVYRKLVASDIVRVFPDEDNATDGIISGTKMKVSKQNLTSGSLTNELTAGEMRYAFSLNDLYRYDKDINSQIPPFTSALSVALNASNDPFEDSDTVAAGASPQWFPAGNIVRYGRLVMQNALGPETEALKIPMTAQYYDGSNYVTNTLDSCSTVNATAMVLNLNLAASGTSSASGSGTVTDGSVALVQQIEMSAPGDTHDGIIDLCLDVDDWLKYDWNGDGIDLAQTCDASSSAVQGDNPMSKATFGQYRGHDKIIYWREMTP